MRTKNKLVWLILVSVLLAVVACEYTEYPDPIWDPDAEGAPPPEITALTPSSLAFEGITIVTIEGNNFHSTLTKNQITFNGFIASIDMDASTSDALVVTTPLVITDATLNAVDSVQIMVAAEGAYAGAVWPGNFRIERAVINWGEFNLDPLESSREPNAVAVGPDETIYVATGASDKKVYKVDSTGVAEEWFSGSGLASNTYDMKVGPGGYVYFTRNIPYLYRIDPAGTEAVRMERSGSKVISFDFNENGDIFVGGKSDSIYVFDATTELPRGVADADDYQYNTMRVLNGYLYIAGEYVGDDDTVTPVKAIWRHEILTGSELGDKELVIDWATTGYTELQDVASLMADEDGILYLGLTEGATTIATLDPATGEMGEFYSAVLAAPATHLSWGTGNYMYMARTSSAASDAVPNSVLRIAQTKSSAPYYGRN